MKNDITCIIPVSAIPSHPDTWVIDETVASIRERLPDSEIIFMFDGIPAWLEQYRQNYDEFKRIFLHKINFDIGNATPLVFETPHHQSGMMREALKLVKTPTILFLEQDTPLHNDIPFSELVPVVETGYANVIRFHFEATIPEAHQHLMLDSAPIEILGQPFIRTRQWSQRPHLASTSYYRSICQKYWDYEPRFIEHIMYGLVAEGGDNYDEHRLHIYAPEGTLVRSKHLDGRRQGAAYYDPTAS